MNTWTMDVGGVKFTADEARGWLHRVIADRDLVGEHWDRLVAIDKGLGLRPPLLWAALLSHRDGVMEDPALWESLNGGLRAWMVVLDDDEVRQLVSMIVDNAVAHYGQAIPDDDDGDWSLWSRDWGRVLTKSEAESEIVGYVLKGERQDMLDSLADWYDEVKVMLAACPLESDSATNELVRRVVHDVISSTYCERPMDR